MAKLVVSTAQLQCPCGASTAALTVLPSRTVQAESQPAGNIMDAAPTTNIAPFGNCKILTAAALGVPTPCVPATVSWSPGSPTVMIEDQPALTDSSVCVCSIGGVVKINDAGQQSVEVADAPLPAAMQAAMDAADQAAAAADQALEAALKAAGVESFEELPLGEPLSEEEMAELLASMEE